MIQNYIQQDWSYVLSPVINSNYFITLGKTIKQERTKKVIYPETNDKVFRCFKETSFNDLKVVILGQDPYHDGSATGLAFANETKPLSPSLRTILNEVYDDIYGNVGPYPDSSLIHWANQGVLLLNSALTVEKGNPLSHVNLWSKFTEEVLSIINNNTTGIVFLCWGAYAKNIINKTINPSLHYILYAGHPSPLNRANPFKGCKHFSKTNEILKSLNGNDAIINW